LFIKKKNTLYIGFVNKLKVIFRILQNSICSFVNLKTEKSYLVFFVQILKKEVWSFDYLKSTLKFIEETLMVDFIENNFLFFNMLKIIITQLSIKNIPVAKTIVEIYFVFENMNMKYLYNKKYNLEIKSIFHKQINKNLTLFTFQSKNEAEFNNVCRNIVYI
jgi:hypothetical protein